MWVSTSFLWIASRLLAAVRGTRRAAEAMTSPAVRRRTQASFVRVVTIVAGH